MSDDPRYPIGPYRRLESVDDAARDADIQAIAEHPLNLMKAVTGLSDAQLDTPYREGGWTVRQVVHHLPDSHMNAYVRMRLAATEDNPPAKTYDEAAWANLADSRQPIKLSLPLLFALHERWTTWLRSLDGPTRSRTVQHADWGVVDIDELTHQYAWHGRHHVAHITSLRERMSW